MSLQVENRGLFTCASWAKWRIGVARDLDISVLLDVQEGIKWWDGEICKWRKGDLGQGSASMKQLNHCHCGSAVCVHA